MEVKDEATIHERQIWWIERVPGDEENNEHPTRQKYTITQCGSGRGLARRGQKVSVYRMRGKPKEHWNFLSGPSQFPQFRHCYSSPILQKNLTPMLMLALTL